MVNPGHLPISEPGPGKPRPPHPVNALRLTQYVSHCKVCGEPTPYTCAQCATEATYCSSAHLLKDWDSHWQECDGSGGTTPAEALEQCMEFMAGRFERGLSLGQSTPKKNLDVERKEEETDSYQWPAPRRVWGLYADPSKDHVTFTEVALKRSVARDGSWTPLVFPYISEPARRMLVPFDRHGRPLAWPLAIYFCLDDYATERNPNRAVKAFVEGSYPDADWWAGPMVVLKATNCDVRDFRDVENGDDIEDIRSFFGQL